MIEILTCCGINKNYTLDLVTAEKTYSLFDVLYYPPGLAVFVTFKSHLAEKVCGIFETKVSFKILAEMLGS